MSPPEKQKVLGMPPFVADFLMGGVSAAVSKTAAAPSSVSSSSSRTRMR
jgi:solute carrier family 25 (adenine nucleotide translocator) protein 4/5/6/31